MYGRYNVCYIMIECRKIVFLPESVVCINIILFVREQKGSRVNVNLFLKVKMAKY